MEETTLSKPRRTKARTQADKNLYLRNGTYYARIQINGRDRRVSLQTGDRTEAKRQVKAHIERAERERSGDYSEHTFAEAAESWAKQGFGVASESTRERYRTSLLMLRPMFAKLRMHEITKRKIGDYVAARVNNKVKHATIRRDITALSGLMRHCMARSWRDDNPAKEYDRGTIKETRDPIHRVCERSYRATIEAAPRKWSVLLRFLRASGFRLNVDAINLKRAAIDWDTGVVTFITKRNRIRARQLSEEALAILREAIPSATSVYVFWELRGDSAEPKLSRAFQDVQKRAVAKAEAEGWPYVPFRLHDLRHEFAISYLKGGGSIYVLQGILGHTSVKTTEIYLDYLTPEEVALAKETGPAQNVAQHRRFLGGQNG